jgi:hypothetical protein
MRKVQSIAKTPWPAPDVVTKTIPAPIEGWDAISPLAAMDPKRAPIMINWVPRPGWIELRAGYTPWTLLASNSPIETLLVYRGTPTQQMFAAQGTGIYNVSTTGGTTAVVTGLASARWQYVQFTPALGTSVIQLVNGVDTLRQYDGTSWTTPTITGLPNSLTTAAIFNIFAQKRRLWYLLKNSTVAAFMPTDAISGAIAGTLDLGAEWTLGGYIVAMADWTVDGGNGPQDYAVFISSRGQVSIYSGTDPTSSSTWSLTGTFNIAPPVGTRCTVGFGSDVGIITQQGVLPLSQVLPFDPSVDRSASITARIQNAMASAALNYGSNFGWELISYPAQQLLILNVPQAENSSQVQYVQNVLSGAWTQFTGWNANTFAIYNDDLYFGGNNGYVNLAYSGGLDLDQPIAAQVQFAYNWFDDPGRTKRVTMLQPLFTASGSFTPLLAVDEDFAVSSAEAPVTIITGGAEWDVAKWDVDLWPGGSTTLTSWYSATAIGHALAIHIYVNIASQLVTGIEGEFDLGTFDTAQFDVGIGSTEPLLQLNAINAIMEMGAFI